MSNNQPLVSIIIPVFNGERFLVNAIENAMQQTHRPIEILIIDDGSTDNTAKIAKQYQQDVQYLYQISNGPAGARNLGLKHAMGEFIAFIAVDDLWPKIDKLEKQVNFLINNIKIDIVRGLIEIIELADAVRTKSEIGKKNNETLNLSFGCALCRKEVFKKVGYFDESLIYGEDLDWYIRALESDIQIAQLNEVMLHYRMHANNITNPNNNQSQSRLKVIKKLLDRRKNNPELYDRFINNFAHKKDSFITKVI